MTDVIGEYINGYLERTKEGNYKGRISIEGVDLSPITGVFFKRTDNQDNATYLWLKRTDILEYDAESQSYKSRKREPRWEAYLKKQVTKDGVIFKGEFPFMRLRFSITGMWDNIFGKEKGRINFYIDRLPQEKQDIMQGIIERQRNDG